MYVDYCTMVFKHFGSRIKLWATMNEPTVCGCVRMCVRMCVCVSVCVCAYVFMCV